MRADISSSEVAADQSEQFGSPLEIPISIHIDQLCTELTILETGSPRGGAARVRS